jgi:eukaryotic-like serine/threonine-protein kinase
MVSIGTTLGGRYRLVDRIAGGGMGDVWRGTDEVLGRTVAVKILLPALLEEPGFAERFRGEARTMATINHPGVVDVYDYGSDPAVGAYLVMEYVEGDALSRTLGRVGRLTPARTMALVAQAADALQAAHDKGIVHRDVKPGNLLVRPNGSLVLTDFGIARSEIVGQLTAAGSVLGTASYISPEQASGSTATALSDVYALGVVAFQCLSGRRPFEGDNPLEIAMRHVRDNPPPLPPDIPPAVRAVVERAMAKDPAARFPTAAALGQVARRTAASLATGNIAAGAGGLPVSVPPVPAQTSPGPQGTAVAAGQRPSVGSAPVAPGGTRVLGGNSSAPPPGVSRGTAAAPPPPVRRADTAYYSSGPAYAPGGDAPPGRGRAGAVVIGIIIGLLVLLLIAGAAWLATQHSNNNGGSSPNTSPTAAQLVDVQCDKLKRLSYNSVQAELTKQGFKVARADAPGGKKDSVADIAPCEAHPNDVITVTVYTGKGGGDNTNSPGDHGTPKSATATPSPEAPGPSVGPSSTCGKGVGQIICPGPSASTR